MVSPGLRNQRTDQKLQLGNDTSRLSRQRRKQDLISCFDDLVEELPIPNENFENGGDQNNWTVDIKQIDLRLSKTNTPTIRKS